MVLKIDHISYSCAVGSKIDEKIKGYTKAFEEVDLPNISCKSSFLKLGSAVHNISMYVSNDGFPVEVTAYPVVDGACDAIEFDGNTVTWHVSDVMAAADLFTSLGARASETEDGLFLLKPFLEKKPLYIKLVEDKEKTASGYLDFEGWSSIGLFVDNSEKEALKLAKKNYQVTGISQITVNSQKLDIAFVKGKNNELIEFISMAKGEKK